MAKSNISERYKYLASKIKEGTATLEEQAEFSAWYNKDQNQEVLIPESFAKNIDVLEKSMFKTILEKRESAKGISLWPRIAVAAAIAVVVFGAGLFYINQKSQNKSQMVVYQKDIEPAGNKAYLTLSSGKRIALDDATNGNIATQANVKITKTADGQLVYTIAESNSSSSSTLEYNTIETPNGGRYEIALPDGTHVWMNAASSLKYPASFASLKERRVELQGEAYFQVAKDKQHPFIVKTVQQEVKVLGTHFNINSYADEPETKTTLLEGSVSIAGLGSKKSKIMVPGQQASVKGHEIKISDADLDQALSWKNGDFIFIGEDLKAVMRQVARWYDVEIEYQGNVNSSGVISTISRTKKLSQVLKALEKNLGIHFKVEGRRVLVMP